MSSSRIPGTASRGPVTEGAGPTGGCCPFVVTILPVPALSTTLAVPTTVAAPMNSGCPSASQSKSKNNQRKSLPLLLDIFNDPENAYWQARKIYKEIWDSKIPKGDLAFLYKWDANPYVWVIEFEQIKV